MAWTSPRTWTTGEVVTATHLNAHIRDNFDAVVPDDTVGAVSWAPALEAVTTDPSTSSVTGRRWRVGPVQFAAVRFQLDGVTLPSGILFVTLPVAASGLTAGTGSGQTIGNWQARDNNTALDYGGTVMLATSTTVRFQQGAGGSSLSNTVPFTWAISDAISFFVMYPAA